MDGSCKNVVFIFVWFLTFSNVDLYIFSASSEVHCILTERDALLEIKSKLSDPSNRLASWSPHTNCCNWALVVCHNVIGHVLELHLTTPSPIGLNDGPFYETLWFGGEVSPFLLELKHLNYLDLSGNYFGDVQIPEFLGLMTSLTYLNLSNAGFGGSIPLQFWNLSNLICLDLGGNSLEGSIPHEIGKLSNLQYLNLRDNELNGTLQGSISNGIQNLTLIQHLDLSQNQFNSSIPNWLYSLRHLKALILSENSLVGAISSNIGNLTSLVTLDLTYNLLEGSIPISVRNLCSMKKLAFSHNKCKQQISEILKILSDGCVSQALEVFYMSGSQLSGNFTDHVGLLKNLVELDLSHNTIQGAIHSSLGDLASLKYLDLSSNAIQGALPSSLGNLKSLAYLFLWNNSINSSVPLSFANLTSMMYLDLSANQLGGNPFEIIGSFSKLNTLHLENNIFQGVVREAHLINFTQLKIFSAHQNKLTLKADPNWNPSFQLLEVLRLASWNLGPHFPSWIQSLKHLEYLDISVTKINDSIPTWFWGTVGNLEYLNLSHNHIKGEFSNILVDATTSYCVVDLSSNKLYGQLPYVSQQVEYIDLSSNFFSGSVTHFLCHQQEETNSLMFLNLASNNLSGTIPDCWMKWPYIVTVNLENNHFTGTLPTSMASLLELQMLNVRYNNFSGNFPSFLKNQKNLISLNLGENQFSGEVPSWVGQRLSSLKILVMRSNKFSGPIPHQICDMSVLQILDLAHNELTEYIPKCVMHLSAMLVINSSLESYISFDGHVPIILNQLLVEALLLKGRVYDYSTNLGLITSIDFSSNGLSGGIPMELTRLKGLIFLNLSNNHFIGQIPQNIGNMESLESLDISRNLLSGEIPPSISKLSFLGMLDMSYNNLTGKIPTGTQLQSFEASSFVGNKLCGPPLANNCSSNTSINKNKEVDHAKGINWFLVSVGFGFIVGFWAIVGPLLYSASWRYAYFQFIDTMGYKLQSSCNC